MLPVVAPRAAASTAAPRNRAAKKPPRGSPRRLHRQEGRLDESRREEGRAEEPPPRKSTPGTASTPAPVVPLPPAADAVVTRHPRPPARRSSTPPPRPAGALGTLASGIPPVRRASRPAGAQPATTGAKPARRPRLDPREKARRDAARPHLRIAEPPLDPTVTGAPSRTGLPLPDLADALEAVVGVLRLGAEAAGIAPEDVERRIAQVLAYIRRRVDGDYDVDDFGYDADFTENVFYPMLRPITALVPGRGAGHREHPEHRWRPRRLEPLRHHRAGLAHGQLAIQPSTPSTRSCAPRRQPRVADTRISAPSRATGRRWRRNERTPSGCSSRARSSACSPRGSRVWARRSASVQVAALRAGWVRRGGPRRPGADHPVLGRRRRGDRADRRQHEHGRAAARPAYAPVTPTFPCPALLGMIPLPSKWLIEFGTPIS